MHQLVMYIYLLHKKCIILFFLNQNLKKQHDKTYNVKSFNLFAHRSNWSVDINTSGYSNKKNHRNIDKNGYKYCRSSADEGGRRDAKNLH
jgi:hypothetical protein